MNRSAALPAPRRAAPVPLGFVAAGEVITAASVPRHLDSCESFMSQALLLPVSSPIAGERSEDRGVPSKGLSGADRTPAGYLS